MSISPTIQQFLFQKTNLRFSSAAGAGKSQIGFNYLGFLGWDRAWHMLSCYPKCEKHFQYFDGVRV